MLERANMQHHGIYMLFNSYSISVYVGRQCDPYYYEELFKVSSFGEIDKSISEDEIFANMAESNYLTALNSIIQQIRYTRQPFCELQILLAGENDSEAAVQSMCIIDENANQRYKIDYNKFI